MSASGARRQSSAINFDDIDDAKSFWEKTLKAKSRPEVKANQALDLKVSLGSSDGKKMFFEEMAAYNAHTKPASSDVKETKKLNDKTEAWEQRFNAAAKNEGGGHGAQLNKEDLAQIQKTKLLWEEKMMTGSSPSSSRRRSIDSDELNESIQNKKQMWEEITANSSLSVSRRRSVDNSDDEENNNSNSLNMSSHSNLDLSEDALSKIQQTKQLWNAAAEKKDMSIVKTADDADSDDSNGEQQQQQQQQAEVFGTIQNKLQHFEVNLANQRRCQSEEVLSRSEEERKPLTRVGSIKLKKELWEKNSRISPDKETDENNPSNLIRVGSLRQRRQMLEEKARSEREEAKPRLSTLEDEEAKQNICQNKARWREIERTKNSQFSNNDKVKDREIKNIEEEILAQCNVQSSDVKVESISNVAGTKSKWENRNSEQTNQETRSKRKSLCAL